MSSTTRSISSSAKRLQRLLAVARLDDAVPVPLERIREELLDRVLVVDEQNGGGFRHRRDRLERGCEPGTPYYSPRRGGLRLIRARRSASGRVRRGRGAKRGARRGSVDQPINGRLVRAASLLVLGPLLLLALTIGRPGPVSRLDAAALVRRRLGRGARDRPGARLSLPRSPARRARRGGAVGEGASSASTGSRAAEDAWDESDPRPRPRPAAEPRHRRARLDATTRSSSSPIATTRASGRARTTTPPARPR